MPTTFTSTLTNTTFLTFTTPPPVNGNPRILRITVKGESEVLNPTVVRLAVKESCDNGITCPVSSPIGIYESSSGVLPSTPWPFDFRIYSYDRVTPIAYATIVQEGLLAPEFVAGMPVSTVTAREGCGCKGRNASSPSYVETWRIALNHRQVTRVPSLPTNQLTITVDALDVCNGHGRWVPALKRCTCEPGYQRGADACSMATSFLTPCCIPCTVGDSALPTLNCTDVLNVVSSSLGTVMPVTQLSGGAQIPGQLPSTSVELFPGERAIVRYASLPKNPRGNPWLLQFRGNHMRKQMDPLNYGHIMHLAGVRTCSRQLNCTSMIPETQRAPPSGATSEWVQTPSLALMRQPLDIGSFAPSQVADDPNVLPLSMKMASLDFTPSSYYRRQEDKYRWQYFPVKNGNNTLIPLECLCEPSFYAAQADSSVLESTVVDSDESWNFASSYLSNQGTNRLQVHGNFSDICAGHGIFLGGDLGCTCDDGYYGQGCASPTWAVPFTLPLSSSPYYVRYNVAPSQCCTGRIAKAPSSTIYPVTIYPTAPADAKFVTAVNDRNVFVAEDPKAIYYYVSTPTYNSMVAYDVDQASVERGLDFSFAITTAIGSACDVSRITTRAWQVCGDWTVDQCFTSVTMSGTQLVDGYAPSTNSYLMRAADNQAHTSCGCGGVDVYVKHIMLMLTTYSTGCLMNVAAASATINCVEGQGVWHMKNGLGFCTCEPGWSGSTCATKESRAITTMVLAPELSRNGLSYKTAEIAVGSAANGGRASLLVRLDVGSPPATLNLNFSGTCTTTTGKWQFEFLRCFDEAPKRLVLGWNVSTPLKPRYYTPDETWAYAQSDLSRTLSLAMVISNDNPFRHCDYQVLTLLSERLLTAKVKNGEMDLATTSGTFTMSRGANSPAPCKYPGADTSCLTSPTYYMIRILNNNAVTCTAKLVQGSGFTCSDSFVTCGPESQGGCQLSNSTLAPVSCGTCAGGWEGIGCTVRASSFVELYNQDKVTLTSRLGEPMRFSLQVSPSNSIKFKLNFPKGSTNCTEVTSNSTSCRVGKIWIRARLGSAPPALITTTVMNEATQTIYFDSDGSDTEARANVEATLSPSHGSATGGAPGSTGGMGPSSVAGTSLRRLLSLEDPGEAPIVEPIYRNDDLRSGQPAELAFPAEERYGGMRLSSHNYLFVEVYHSNLMDASADAKSFGHMQMDSDSYATQMEVEIVIMDSLGTLVGWIAVAILGSFGFFALCYLLYLRCRYGSVIDGVEASVLEKTKVSRQVAPTKSPKQLAKEAQRKAEERRKKKELIRLGKAGKAPQSKICKFLMLLPLIIAFCLLLLFELLKVLFNISILHTSVGSFLPVIEFDKVASAVSHALDDLGLSRLHDVWATFNKFFDFLGIFNEVSLKWNCGGALSMFAPVVILLGSIVLCVVLQKDYFLRFSLSMKGSTEGSSKIARKLRAAIATVFSTMLLYTLQSSILVLTQVVASTWNIKRSCSANDALLVYIGRYLCIVFIVLLFYVSGLMFAGIKTINSNTLTVGWVTGVWALLQLTIGIWRQSTIERFDIVSRARDFDIDDNHDENPEEAVMELQAASRGLMWTAFPVGIVLTKLTEQINAPPVLLVGDYLGVTITTPRWHRCFRWTVGMAKMCAVFYTVWSANLLVVMIAFGLTALSVALLVILPTDYHRKKWLADHPEEVDHDESDSEDEEASGTSPKGMTSPQGVQLSTFAPSSPSFGTPMSPSPP